MKSLSKKGMLRLALALPLLIIAVLNVNGFCWQQKRFLSDQELIDAAIRLRLRSHEGDGPYAKIYKSVEEFKDLNPGCCILKRQQNEGSELPQVISSMLGMYISTVELTYRIADAGPEPFYEAFVFIDCCGDKRGFYGMPQASGPRTSMSDSVNLNWEQLTPEVMTTLFEYGAHLKGAFTQVSTQTTVPVSRPS